MTCVFDSSAILAYFSNEPGSAVVVERMREDWSISAVNLSEVIAKIVERGGTDGQIDAAMTQLAARVQPFDAEQARAAGVLRRPTRSAGLSLGDRACLALALRLGAPVLTTDRSWAGLDLGVPVEVIR